MPIAHTRYLLRENQVNIRLVLRRVELLALLRERGVEGLKSKIFLEAFDENNKKVGIRRVSTEELAEMLRGIDIEYAPNHGANGKK